MISGAPTLPYKIPSSLALASMVMLCLESASANWRPVWRGGPSRSLAAWSDAFRPSACDGRSRWSPGPGAAGSSARSRRMIPRCRLACPNDRPTGSAAVDAAVSALGQPLVCCCFHGSPCVTGRVPPAVVILLSGRQADLLQNGISSSGGGAAAVVARAGALRRGGRLLAGGSAKFALVVLRSAARLDPSAAATSASTFAADHAHVSQTTRSLDRFCPSDSHWLQLESSFDQHGRALAQILTRDFRGASPEGAIDERDLFDPIAVWASLRLSLTARPISATAVPLCRYLISTSRVRFTHQNHAVEMAMAILRKREAGVQTSN